MGLDWVGLDWDGIRVFGGIEHLTVLIRAPVGAENLLIGLGCIELFIPSYLKISLDRRGYVYHPIHLSSQQCTDNTFISQSCDQGH